MESSGEIDPREAWYEKAEGQAHRAAFAAALRCIGRDSRRARLRKMRTIAKGGDLDSPSEHKVIANAIDTLVSKIGKSEVMPIARAVGMRRSQQERAKRLSHWIRGQVVELKVHRLARRALRDAATYGSGALHTFRGLDDRPRVERVWIGNLGVEEWEEECGDVRTLFRMMTIDRAVAVKRWRSKAAELRLAEYSFSDERGSRTIVGAPITVMECWHLTTGGVVGRHVICTSSCTLVDDKEWDRQAFPVKFLHWVEDTEMFFGVGLVEAMAGEQAALDSITEKIEECFDMGGPKIVVDTVGDVTCEKLTNRPYEVIKYTSSAGGQPPQWISPPAISADYRQHQETLIDRCYEMHGISQLSATSRKPAGLDSAIALDTYSDIESERFYPQTRDFEGLVVETGEGLIDVAEELANDKEMNDAAKADVLCTTKAEVRLIRYVDARLPAKMRTLEVESVSLFSNTFSGRVQQLDHLRQMGVVKGEDQFLELMDDPNLRKLRSLASAGRHTVEVQVERCLASKRQTPDPAMPLPYALEYATKSLLDALLEIGIDEDSAADAELEKGLQALRGYIADVDSFIRQAEDDAAAKAAPPPPSALPAMAAMPAAMGALGPAGAMAAQAVDTAPGS